MSKPTVAVFDTKSYDQEFFNMTNADYGFELRYFEFRVTKENAVVTEGADCACVFVNDQVTSEVVDVFADRGVKLLALRSAGYNHVDLEALKGRIDIVRVPAYSPHAVAEHALALMLTLNRKTHRAYNRTRDSNFAIAGLIGFDMYQKTAGIIGTGQIGRIMAEILRGMQMRVVVYDPYPNREWAAKWDVEYVKLSELYRQSDVISLHCPLTPENVYMINRASIDQMKRGVMIINTGRGKLIRTEDLLEALRSGKIGSAGLDVYEEETHYFFEDHSSNIVTDDNLLRLLAYPNVLVTGHQAFFTREALTNIAGVTLENIRTYFDEGRIENGVPDFDAKTGRLKKDQKPAKQADQSGKDSPKDS